MLSNDGSYEVEWVCNSERVKALVDFTKPFNVSFSCQPIHDHLASICENHFGGLRSGINNSWQGFFEVEVTKGKGTFLSVNVKQLICELDGGVCINDKFKPLHIRENFIAFISNSDKGNVALIVAPAYYQTAASGICDKSNIEQTGKGLSANEEALINFFVENCCLIAGGILPSGKRVGGFNASDAFHANSFSMQPNG